jgi:hypothetical protein
MFRVEECILHVGTEKTGSTTLQFFLGLNRVALLEQGVFVPSSIAPHAAAGILNHIDLTTASRTNVTEFDDLQIDAGITSAQDIEKHRNCVIQRLSEELSIIGTNPKRLIISNEHIQSRLRSDRELRNLRDLLEPYCDRFRIAVYLRAQHEMAESVTSTAIKNGQTEIRLIPTFSDENGFDPVLGVDVDYFDHFKLLSRLSKVFGQDAIDVRLYESSALINGDVVDDFFSRLNIDITSMCRPARVNTGLSASALRFLAVANKYFKDIPQGETARGAVRDYLADVSRGKNAKPSKRMVTDFLAIFAESNELVRRRWFPLRPALFEVALTQYPEVMALPELSEEDVFAFLAGFAIRVTTGR